MQIVKRLTSKFEVTQRSISNSNGLARTLAARDYKDPQCVRLNHVADIVNAKLSESSCRIYSADGICPTVQTCGGGYREPKVIYALDEQNARINSVCGTLTTDGSTPKHNNRVLTTSRVYNNNDIDELTKDLESGDTVVRKLTPLECWRLMGFTDEDFTRAKTALNDTYYKGKDRSSSQLYKQAGNSIVVGVLERIFRNMR